MTTKAMLYNIISLKKRFKGNGKGEKIIESTKDWVIQNTKSQHGGEIL